MRRFVTEGAEVCIADIAVDAAEALADELDGRAWAIECNVRDEAAVEAVATAVAERWEHLDILVNNAGSELNQTYDQTTVDEWQRVIDTDLRGPWLFCKHLVPPMVAHGRAASSTCRHSTASSGSR